MAMVMTPGVRRFALVAHVAFSVAWLGAVVTFLALAIAGVTSQDAQLVRAAYLAMAFTGWRVIVPLCFGSLLTGLVEALGTTWGLFRHYWVVMKLTITVFATVLLLVHLRPASYLATAAHMALSSTDYRGVRFRLLGDAGAASAVLLLLTTLAVYKPAGMTPYGWRTRHAVGDLEGEPSAMPRWVVVFGVAFLLLLLARHLVMGEHSGHGS